MKTPRRPSKAKVTPQGVGESLDRNAKLDAAFGLWRDQAVDGLNYQRKVRGEWLGRSSTPKS